MNTTLIEMILKSDFVEVNGVEIDSSLFEYFYDPLVINVKIDRRDFAFDSKTEIDFSKQNDDDGSFEVKAKNGVTFKMAFISGSNLL